MMFSGSTKSVSSESNAFGIVDICSLPCSFYEGSAARSSSASGLGRGRRRAARGGRGRGLLLRLVQNLAHPYVVYERREVLREAVQHDLEVLHLLEGALDLVHVAAELAPVLVHQEVHRLLAEVFEVTDERVLEEDAVRLLRRPDFL